MSELLSGKVALVTGAGSGIGRASARTFAREGAKVVVSDINADGAEQTVRLIRDAGGEASFVACDVTDASQVRNLIAKCVELFGALHCAHNNAGVEGRYGRTLDTDEANFDLTYSVNLKGVFLCMQAELAHMLEHGGGRIVNTASVAGIEGAKNMPAYVASKHAVLGLTRTTALEYGAKGIRINAVCPGPIRTPMLEKLMAQNPRMESAAIAAVPVKRLGEPQDIAEAALWLCTDRADFVNGHALVVDGGMTAGS
ncbi:MAG: NAD(P)-dependent dehydrogenase (short-subunit alcohol dehydrogenase family) [Gammaproteobacteria bacterium]|jgi:NAD(P)-dependent dehydrogenase (short-subunit alcohol dehydrogenase family)